MSKYKNPIVKLETVNIQTWEYAALVRDKTLLEVVRRLIPATESYNLKSAIMTVLGEDDYDKAEEAAKRG